MKQETEKVTRTDTATLIKACRALEADCDVANLVSITIHFSDDIKSDQAFENSVLSQIADRLEEQEATIRHLRVSLCEASAVAMEVAELCEKQKEASLRDLKLNDLFPWGDSRVKTTWRRQKDEKLVTFRDLVMIGRSSIANKYRFIGKTAVRSLDPIFIEKGLGDVWMKS
jgi:hypothetical protein